MYKDQPLTLASMLPAWMSVEEFYTYAGGMGLLAMGLAIVLPSVMQKKNRSAKRLKILQERRAELRGELMKSNRRRKKSADNSVNMMRQVVNRFQLLKSSGIAQVQSMMVEAGYRSKDALVIYAFFTLVAPIVFLIVGLVMMSTIDWGTGPTSKFAYVPPVALAYMGLKLPYWVVKRARKKRYYRVQRALSDTLDLMTICAEAGLSLAMSLDRVSRELGIAYPDMAEELSLTATELGFLPDRNKALLNLSERVKLPEIRGIVSVLIQTEKYGTPISQAMRVLSAEFREQRMLRAETKAARLPALMTVPMIVFILPTLFIVILTPAIIRIASSQ